MRVLILSCAFLLLMPWLMHFAWFILDCLCVFLLLFHFSSQTNNYYKSWRKKDEKLRSNCTRTGVIITIMLCYEHQSTWLLACAHLCNCMRSAHTRCNTHVCNYIHSTSLPIFFGNSFLVYIHWSLDTDVENKH